MSDPTTITSRALRSVPGIAKASRNAAGRDDAAAPADDLRERDEQEVAARVRRIVKPWRTRSANALPAIFSAPRGEHAGEQERASPGSP